MPLALRRRLKLQHDLRFPAEDGRRSSLSLMRPAGSSVADDAAYNTLSIHDAGQRSVNFRSPNGLTSVQFRSTRKIGRGRGDGVRCISQPLIETELASVRRQDRNMTSAKLVTHGLDFWEISSGPLGYCYRFHIADSVETAPYDAASDRMLRRGKREVNSFRGYIIPAWLAM